MKVSILVSQTGYIIRINRVIVKELKNPLSKKKFERADHKHQYKLEAIQWVKNNIKEE